MHAHDPKALDHLKKEMGDKVRGFADAYEAAQGCDALIICTEWNEYRSADFDRLKTLLKAPVIFDGRNLYSVEQMRRRGFSYYSIGRPAVKSGQ